MMKDFILLSLLAISTSTGYSQDQYILPSPQWLDTGIIYEVNIRQYTPEGTFKAFQKHIPRLQQMGVNILWLMPIYPVSRVKRKGSLGSYYAVSSYTEVNPEFGNKKDLKQLIDLAHSHGMKIILDWVPNHTGWDHSWIMSYPEWYIKNPVTDTIMHPEHTDWYDVADLNFESISMRQEMLKSMLYWLNEFQVDGFRCDVAYKVPELFWQEMKRAFSNYKRPLFLLAESEDPQLLSYGHFHADYPWPYMHLCRDIYAGLKTAYDLRSYLMQDQKKLIHGYHMFFTSNHDENSWKGVESVLLGDAHLMFAAMSFMLNGIPMIYSGQEEPLMKQLRFFDKDTIPFAHFLKAPFYNKLCKIKKANPAFYPVKSGMQYEFIQTDQESKIFALRRIKDENEVLGFFNCSPETVSFQIQSSLVSSKYQDAFSGIHQKLSSGNSMTLKPWDFKIFTSNSR